MYDAFTRKIWIAACTSQYTVGIYARSRGVAVFLLGLSVPASSVCAC